MSVHRNSNSNASVPSVTTLDATCTRVSYANDTLFVKNYKSALFTDIHNPYIDKRHDTTIKIN